MCPDDGRILFFCLYELICLMYRRFLFGLLLLCGMSAWAQNKLSPETRVVLEEMKAGRNGGGYIMSGVKGDNSISAFVKLRPGATADVLADCGCTVGTVAGRFVTVSVPAESIDEVVALDEVEYIQAGVPVEPQMNKARAASNVDKVQAGEGLEQPFLGDGVVVGIIDNGFEYGHVNFWNADKTELRIRKVWDQNETAGNVPEKYGYGAEYVTQDEILAAEYDGTEVHATHVLGIAAGADRSDDNQFYGVAGNADIVAVSRNTSGNSVNIADAVNYIFDYADEVKKPCVINMSLATHIGPHDGTSAFDVMMDSLLGRGRLLVGSAGNEGDINFHVSKNFSQAGERPVKTFVQMLNTTAVVDVWGEPEMDYDLEFHIYDYNTDAVIPYDTINVLTAEPLETIEFGDESDVDGYVRVSSEVSPLNGKTHAYLYFNVTRIGRDRYIGMSIIPKSAGMVHAWADAYRANLVSNFITGYTNGNGKYSVGEIGGTGNSIISVGAYVSSNSYKAENSSSETPTGTILGSLASFSSIGPRADGVVKPDITAPGAIVCSSVSSAGSISIVGKTVNWQNKNYRYGYMSGTSMSAPYVTGVLATWLQAYPRLNPQLVKEIFKTTSLTDESTGEIDEEGDNSWGYGKIDAWEGIKKAIVMREQDAVADAEALTEGVRLLSASEDGIGLLFMHSDRDVTVNIYSISGSVVSGIRLASVEAGEEVRIGSLPCGYYLIKVTGRNTDEVLKVVCKK